MPRMATERLARLKWYWESPCTGDMPYKDAQKDALELIEELIAERERYDKLFDVEGITERFKAMARDAFCDQRELMEARLKLSNLQRLIGQAMETFE